MAIEHISTHQDYLDTDRLSLIREVPMVTTKVRPGIAVGAAPRPFRHLRFWKLLARTLQMKAKFYLNGNKSYTNHIYRFYTRDINSHCETFGDKFAAIREEMVELAEPWPGDLVLDVGTGVGWQAAAFARRGLECTGVDYVPDRLKHAEEIHGNEITWMVGDASNLPLETDSFDIVSVSLILHDLPLDRELEALRELRRVSRRRVIIVEPQVPPHWFIRWLYIFIGDLFDESVYFGNFVRRDFEAHLETAGLKLVNKKVVFHGGLTIFVCDV
jgi:ubiquinone/menaquinone biosynthesis C-methylase UbiE